MEKEKPLKEWARYNQRNILGNLVEVEDHSRVLMGKGREADKSCLNKHLAFISSELGELASHTDSNKSAYASLRLSVDKLYDDLSELSPEQILKRTRQIRGKFEDVAGISVKYCGACSVSLPELSSIIDQHISEREKYLNMDKIREHLNRDKTIIKSGDKIIMEYSEVMELGTGNLIGKGIEELSERFITGTTFGLPRSRLAEIGLGLALPVGSIYGVVPRAWQRIATVAGLFLLVNAGVDMVTERLMPAAAVTRAPVRVRAAPRATCPSSIVTRTKAAEIAGA